MSQVEINVFETQSLDGVLSSLKGILGTEVAGPELGGDEEFLPLDLSSIDSLLDSLSNRGFIVIDGSGVNEAVPGVNGSVDSGLYLSRGTLKNNKRK